jgi:hypothetical protein
MYIRCFDQRTRARSQMAIELVFASIPPGSSHAGMVDRAGGCTGAAAALGDRKRTPARNVHRHREVTCGYDALSTRTP